MRRKRQRAKDPSSKPNYIIQKSDLTRLKRNERHAAFHYYFMYNTDQRVMFPPGVQVSSFSFSETYDSVGDPQPLGWRRLHDAAALKAKLAAGSDCSSSSYKVSAFHELRRVINIIIAEHSSTRGLHLLPLV